MSDKKPKAKVVSSFRASEQLVVKAQKKALKKKTTLSAEIEKFLFDYTQS